MDPERERLLVELLTLNFHEHFEFKPLLEEAYKRQLKKDARERLESVARRVIDRQVNMLAAVSETTKGPYKSETKAYAFVDSSSSISQNASHATGPERCVLETADDSLGDFSELSLKPICAPSPDKKLCLEIALYRPDYRNKSVLANVKVYSTGSQGCEKRKKEESSDKPLVFIPDLRVSAFDCPLTDNTAIDPHHRFALSLYYMDAQGRPMQFKLIWFPEGYIGDRERPINYDEIRKLLGVRNETKQKLIW